MSAALADPEVVARAAAEADQDARRLLEEARAATGPDHRDGGRLRPLRRLPRRRAGQLAAGARAAPARHLQPAGGPEGGRLGLRGGLVFPEWPEPPASNPSTRSPTARPGRPPPPPRPWSPPRASCARLDREPLTLTRAGTVAVRDLGRLARDLDLADEELALLVDLLVETGVLAVGGPFGQRSLGLRPEADAWLAVRGPAAGPSRRRLALRPTSPSRTTWSPATPGGGKAPAGDRLRPDPPRQHQRGPRSGAGPRPRRPPPPPPPPPAARAARQVLLGPARATSPGGRRPPVGTLAPLLAWRQPMA